MNFDFAEKINPDLEQLKFDKAIAFAENELVKIPNSVFHTVINKSLVIQAEDLASWAEFFYKLASKKVNVQALYFEMNEFDINTEDWYIDVFAYSKDGGLHPEDMEWISDYDADSQSETETVFVIAGYEDLQEAFKNVELVTDELQNSRDWCEQLIIARFMQLIYAAHQLAKTQQLSWGAVPIYFTEHAYDFIVQSK